MTCEHDLIAASGEFDESGYVWHNRELHWCLCGHFEGLRHFVRYGWRQLRNPSPAVRRVVVLADLPRPRSEDVNPLVHYLAEGRHRGHATCPRCSRSARRRPRRPSGPRRVCLFAGFDGDGLVDDNVVAYVRELSRFADVYYLADCPLEAGELDKLAPYTKRPVGDPARPLRLRLLLDAGARARRLGRDRDVRRAAAGQRQLLPGAAAGRGVRHDGRPPAHWWGLQATYDDFTPGDLERLGRRLRVDDLVARPARSPVAQLRLLPRRLVLPGAAVGGDRRPGVPASAGHGRAASRTRTRSSGSTRSASPAT